MTDQTRFDPDRTANPSPDPVGDRRPESIPRAIIDNMPAPVAWHRIVLDDSGRPVDFVFLEVNRAFEELTGLAADDLVGRRPGEVLPGSAEPDSGWVQAYGRVAQTGREVSFEQYSPVLDRWFLITAYSPATGEFVTFFQDITEARQAAEDLADLAARHQTVLESCPAPVVICDHEDSIRYLNPALERVLGWTLADLLDKPITRLLGQPPGDGPGGPATVKTGDGRELSATLVVSPLTDAAGDPAGHIVFIDPHSS
jgi:PAS domain S-box-containing protein